jgi:hypothetical protein
MLKSELQKIIFDFERVKLVTISTLQSSLFLMILRNFLRFYLQLPAATI